MAHRLLSQDSWCLPQTFKQKKWQTCKDSNLNKVNQNHLCYRYTTGLRAFIIYSGKIKNANAIGKEFLIFPVSHLPNLIFSIIRCMKCGSEFRGILKFSGQEQSIQLALTLKTLYSIY